MTSLSDNQSSSRSPSSRFFFVLNLETLLSKHINTLCFAMARHLFQLNSIGITTELISNCSQNLTQGIIL